jgi:NitT/TauT family transport system permease protein
MSRAKAIGRGALLPIVLFALWEMAARSPAGDPIYSPSLLRIGSALTDLLVTGDLVRHLSASAVRALGGFALAFVLAVPLGLATGASNGLRRLVFPLLELVRPFPSVTLVPVAMVWLGIGDAQKIFLVAYACFWPIFLNTTTGARETSPLLVRAAKVMELEGWALFSKVILPAALPAIVTGARISLSLSVVVLIVSEMVGAASGIGFLVLDAERTYRTGRMFAAILVMGLVGASLNLAARAVERRLLRPRGAGTPEVS